MAAAEDIASGTPSAQPAPSPRSEISLWTAVAESVTGLFGTEFLVGLVAALRDVIRVDLALVTIGLGTPPSRARSVYAVKDRRPVETIEYDLDGTPCQLVFEGQTITIPCNLGIRFPKEVGFESYVGVPLRSADGAVIGHLAILSADSIARDDLATSLMRVFAVRAEAEYRRERADGERERLIADLTHVSRRLARRYQKIHDANAFKTRLLGMIAHDLRNPLAAIISTSELVESLLAADPPRHDQARDRCHGIIAGAERMDGLIRRTLQQAREESRAIDLAKRPVDLAEVARLAVDVNRQAAARKDMDLVVAADPVCVLGDEDLLLEAVDNLISNAIKYAHPGTPIHITVGADQASGVIRVADQGQGLSEEDLRSVFQEYQTLSARPTGGEPAVGLGLANVKAIAEAHGGRATAESAGKGRGAAFSLILPRAEPSPPAEDRGGRRTT